MTSAFEVQQVMFQTEPKLFSFFLSLYILFHDIGYGLSKSRLAVPITEYNTCALRRDDTEFNSRGTSI